MTSNYLPQFLTVLNGIREFLLKRSNLGVAENGKPHNADAAFIKDHNCRDCSETVSMFQQWYEEMIERRLVPQESYDGQTNTAYANGKELGKVFASLQPFSP